MKSVAENVFLEIRECCAPSGCRRVNTFVMAVIVVDQSPPTVCVLRAQSICCRFIYVAVAQKK